ncbi:MAG TPA: hypothetical protein VHZ29_18570 [Rhizomicrobium sp.]|jgi:hypothetical protein|nr:hypothetical protein [Rhizomicrobium sp.]
MLHRRGVLGLLASAPLLAGCTWRADDLTFRYRLEITLTVDGVVRRGASVIEACWARTWPHIVTAPRYFAFAVGEAVTFDFGKGDYLFTALLPPGQERGFAASRPAFALLQYLPPSLQANAGSDADDPEPLNNALNNLSDRCDVPRAQWPVFLRFDDRRDPLSVKLVKRAQMGITYGRSVEVESVTIEGTGDPLTTGIENILPWLKTRKRSMEQDGDEMTLANQFAWGVTPAAFKSDMQSTMAG